VQLQEQQDADDALVPKIQRMEAKFDKQLQALGPQNNVERYLQRMRDTGGRLKESQRSWLLSLVDAAQASAKHGLDSVNKVVRVWYGKMEVDAPDVFRGFFVKPGGEGLRNRWAQHQVREITRRVIQQEEKAEDHEVQMTLDGQQYSRDVLFANCRAIVDEARERELMAKEEIRMRKYMDDLREHLRLLRLELEREAEERAAMQFEEEMQRWTGVEVERLEKEERVRLEEERARREAEEKHSKRLARRGRGAKLAMSKGQMGRGKASKIKVGVGVGVGVGRALGCNSKRWRSRACVLCAVGSPQG
jgi:hypothetical protein